MTYPIGGNPLPVYVKGGDSLDVNLGGTSVIEVTEGLDGNAIGMVRQTDPVNSFIMNGTGVSDAIDKRGYALAGLIIGSNFTGTKIRYQVSLDANVDWAYLIDPDTGTPYEATLSAGIKNAISAQDYTFAFPFFRIVFLNGSNVVQNQTNLEIRYSLQT